MVDKIWYNMEELIGGSEERGINRNILECKGYDDTLICNVCLSINRNILECKVFQVKNSIFSIFCINRNILECKERNERPDQESCRVLIETYWNVKTSYVLDVTGRSDVLIETYWNVKHILTVLLPDVIWVLIETYWNVKKKEGEFV